VTTDRLCTLSQGCTLSQKIALKVNLSKSAWDFKRKLRIEEETLKKITDVLGGNEERAQRFWHEYFQAFKQISEELGIEESFDFY